MSRRPGPTARLGLAALAASLAALALTGAATAPLAGDPRRGVEMFLVCSACHSATPDGIALIGPSLWEIVGRAVATVPDFEYSDALKALGGTWTAERLDQYLADPLAYAPGTRMGFAGITRPQDRADLIAYLATLHGAAAAAADAGAVDFGPDWPVGPGQTETGVLCNACHSLAIVKQQRLSRATWDALLVWMVEEQGMPELGAEQRALVLDYLTTHFGPPG